jgi:gamma-carbonic anhydrase
LSGGLASRPGWLVAVGDPAQGLAAERHDGIWEVQRTLDFPGTVFGLQCDTRDQAAKTARGYAELFGAHRSGRVVERQAPARSGSYPDANSAQG